MSAVEHVISFPICLTAGALPGREVYMHRDIFVDVELGFSEQNLHILNTAVNAFAEFDPLVARVLQLSKDGGWPREFTVVTIAYYLLHRHKDEYRGLAADSSQPLPPLRISVDLKPATVAALQSLLKLLQAYPPVQSSAEGREHICAACEEDVKLHRPDCSFVNAIKEAEHLLRVA